MSQVHAAPRGLHGLDRTDGNPVQGLVHNNPWFTSVSDGFLGFCGKNALPALGHHIPTLPVDRIAQRLACRAGKRMAACLRDKDQGVRPHARRGDDPAARVARPASPRCRHHEQTGPAQRFRTKALRAPDDGRGTAMLTGWSVVDAVRCDAPARGRGRATAIATLGSKRRTRRAGRTRNNR